MISFVLAIVIVLVQKALGILLRMEQDIVVFDTETTGLHPHEGERIVELAAVRLRKGKVVGRFHTYLNPGRSSNPFALKVHGLADEFLLGAPKFKDIVGLWEEFVGNATLVAHYSVFDIGHLQAVYDDIGRQRPANNVLCTKVLARLVVPVASYRLVHLVDYFGVDARPAHTADRKSTRLNSSH